MERFPSSQSSPAEIARANKRTILATVSRAYNVPMNALSLQVDSSFASAEDDGSITFFVMHWDGRTFAVNAFVDDDDSLTNITHGQI
jgi:hypothetical protein